MTIDFHLKILLAAAALIGFTTFSTRYLAVDGATFDAATRIVHEEDARDIAGLAKISAQDAIKIALGKQAGHAVEVELEAEQRDGKPIVIWSVVILAGQALHEFEIDAVSGALLVDQGDGDDDDEDEADEEDDHEDEDEAGDDDGDEDDDEDEDEDHEEVRELRGFRTALRHAEHDLATLIGKAESFVKGKVVAAVLEYDDGGPVCEVVFANGRALIEVEVEARAGHLIEIELVAEMGGAEADDDDHEARGDHDDDDDEADDDEDGDDHDDDEDHDDHDDDEDHDDDDN